MDTLAIHGGTPVRTAPFPQRTPYGRKEIELVTAAIQSQNLFGPSGTYVKDFEKQFAGLYDAKYSVASTSGTAAIHIAVGTVDPEPGDEIITAPITDGGGIVPILYQNAIPIFADIDASYNMDPADVERKITDRTKAILVVHLFGNPCNIEVMLEIARKYKIDLIEDCSQAHMTEYKGRLLGTFGDIATYSLQQSKHMTTGDGGVTTTDRDDLAERMTFFRDKGFARSKPAGDPRMYAFLAPNYRMTELQGAVGQAQIEKVRSVVKRRNELGDYMSSLIADIKGIAPAPVTEGGKHTYWLYPLIVTDWPVKDFADALQGEGVSAGGGYIGKPIFLCMDALARKRTFGTSGHPLDGCHRGRNIEYTEGMCPRTEAGLQRLVTLPLNENYSKKDIEDMAAAVRKVADALRAGQRM